MWSHITLTVEISGTTIYGEQQVQISEKRIIQLHHTKINVM